MRRAFSLAVNRTEIVEHIAGGGNAPALGFVPPVYSAAGADLFIDRAVQQARALFEEALSEMGLDRSTLGPIRISVYPSPVQEKVVQTVARQWEEAFDIKVIIEKSDWSAHLTKLTQKDFQVLCINWYADVPDASTFLAAFDAEQDNLTGWEDERYSQLVRSVATELDTDKRTELIARAEKYLIEAMPAIPLYYNGPSYLINDRLRDVGVSELGLIEFRWASFKPEADL
jgi:oligopeptide transport system substrate-binding protein